MLLILDVVRVLTALGNILFFLYLIRFLSRSVDNVFFTDQIKYIKEEVLGLEHVDFYILSNVFLFSFFFLFPFFARFCEDRPLDNNNS